MVMSPTMVFFAKSGDNMTSTAYQIGNVCTSVYTKIQYERTYSYFGLEPKWVTVGVFAINRYLGI